MTKYFFSKKNNKIFPYIIAEIGVNHECSLKKAKKLIDLAASSGANSAKFQTYKAEKLASKYSPAYWDMKKEKTSSQYVLFKKYDKFDNSHYRELYKHCKKRKIDFSSTPFDEEAVDFLNPFLKFFKVASADINNLPLLKKVASKKKPVILSTGASNISEIKFAISYLKKFGCKEIVIMHCILSYPTSDENANLDMISDLKKTFPNNIIGYSDHTLPNQNMVNLVTANILGAQVIEKHFTDNKKKKGNDHFHSMDSRDLRGFFKLNKKIKQIRGKNKKRVIKCELQSRKYARRSIVISKDIKKGERIVKSSLTTKRPGTGVTPNFIEKVIGKKAKKNLKNDHVLSWSDIR